MLVEKDELQPEDDSFEVILEDDGWETETEEEATPVADDTPDDLPDKYKGKSVSEIARMHMEAEKLIGKQGQELGDLKKRAEQPVERNEAKTINTLEDTELDATIEYVKEQIRKPNAALDDESYGNNIILYDELKEEKRKRSLLVERKMQTVSSANEKVMADFKAKYGEAITFDMLSEIGKTAGRLSEDGIIGIQQMQAALLAIYPEKFDTLVMKKSVDRKVEDAKSAAKIAEQPRVGTTGSNSPVKTPARYTVSEIAALPQYEQVKILRSMTPEQREKLKKQISGG